MEKISLLGKETLSYDGYKETNGQIITEESHKLFGDSYIVAYEDGRLETYFKSQMRHISKRRGNEIGVFYK